MRMPKPPLRSGLAGVCSFVLCAAVIAGGLSLARPAIAAGSYGSAAVAAQAVPAAVDPADVCGGPGRYFLGVPSWDRGLGDCDNINSDELLSGEKARIITLNIMAILTHLAAFVAVGFVIFGGFKFVLSTGNADQAADARKTIINAGIGAVIVVMARVITEIIYNNLTGG